MSEIRYCPKCRRNVDISPWDTTSIIILIILLLLGIILGVIYLVYKLVKAKSCPVCGTLEMDLEQPRYERADSTSKTFCTNCGKEIPANSRFCPECGSSRE